MSVAFSQSSSNINNNIRSSTSSFAAKLRRLKIEESILLQNISKSGHTHSLSESEVSQTNYLTFAECKKFCTQTKNSYNELKQLFQDIKANTSSKEMIKAIDIDEIKKCTHELESNMKSFKLYLHTELKALKSAEWELNQQINDPIAMKYLKRKPRVHTAKYTEIVPSPVKTLMTSPFKCSEVQEFQEFMKNSKNRYGGWDEYHHNIFVNIWQKYYNAESLADDSTKVLETVENSSEFRQFLRELTPKLIGLSEQEVISHVKWFAKYLYLKIRQQEAIDKWRSNRRMMKATNVKKEVDNEPQNEKRCVSGKKTKRDNCDDRHLNNILDYLSTQQEHKSVVRNKSTHFTRKCEVDELQSDISSCYDGDEKDDQHSFHYLKSTKQWNIRCSSKNINNETEIINDVENLKKL